MNHRPFEDWLFSDEPLAPPDAAALQVHLEACTECQTLALAWRAVDTNLRRTPQVEPAPGFATRWQERLEWDRQHLHTRQSLFALGYFLAGAALLSASLLVLALPLLRTPDVLFWVWAYRLTTLASYADALRDTLLGLTRLVAGGLPLGAWVLFVGLVSELGALWVVAYRWLTTPRRVTE